MHKRLTTYYVLLTTYYNKQALKANTARARPRTLVDPSHKVLWVRLMHLVRNEADVARDATKGVLATCSNPATTDRRKDRGGAPGELFNSEIP